MCMCVYCVVYMQPFCVRLHVNVSFRRLNRANVHIIISYLQDSRKYSPRPNTILHYYQFIFALCFFLARIHLKTYSLFFFLARININIVSFAYFLYQNQFRVCSSQIAANVIALLHIAFTVRTMCVCVCLCDFRNIFIGKCTKQNEQQ